MFSIHLSTQLAWVTLLLTQHDLISGKEGGGDGSLGFVPSFPSRWVTTWWEYYRGCGVKQYIFLNLFCVSFQASAPSLVFSPHGHLKRLMLNHQSWQTSSWQSHLIDGELFQVTQHKFALPSSHLRVRVKTGEFWSFFSANQLSRCISYSIFVHSWHNFVQTYMSGICSYVKRGVLRSFYEPVISLFSWANFYNFVQTCQIFSHSENESHIWAKELCSRSGIHTSYVKS